MAWSAFCSSAQRPPFARLHTPASLRLQRSLGGRPLLPHCWRKLQPQRGARSRNPRPRPCSAAGWPPDDGPLMALLELRSKLKPLKLAFVHTVQALWAAQRRWLQHALARLALGFGLLAAAATLAANVWCVPAMNHHIVPQVQAAASTLLQREVDLGAVRWVAPTGLVGLTPLGCLGPVRVGPGPVEASSAAVERVTVCVDAVQSLQQRRIVLAVKAQTAHVDLVQASNYSWFGYPDDTTPSARDFTPGANGSTGTGTGADSGAGGSSEAGAAHAASPGSAFVGSAGSAGDQHPTTATADARQRLEAAAGRAAAGSRHLQELVERLTRDVLQGVDRPSEQPAEVMLMGFGGASASEAVQGHSRDCDGGSRFAAGSSSLLFSQGHQQQHQHQQHQQQQQQQQQQQPQQPIKEGHQARPALGSGGGGFFGGEFGWPRWQPPAQVGQPDQPDAQQLPSSSPVPSNSGSSQQWQQHVAALNRMKLQAGRGFSLQQTGRPSTAALASSSADAEQECAHPSSSRNVADEAANASMAPAHAGLPLQSQRVAGQQEQLQGTIVDLRSAALAQQEQQAVEAALAGSQTSAIEAGASGSAAPGLTAKGRGSAAVLNKQLQPLQAHRKLYSARPSHLAEQELASSLTAATTAQPDGRAVAAKAEEAVAEPVFGMTADQRQEAVASINSLPAIAVLPKQSAPADAARSLVAHSPGAGSIGAASEQHLQTAGHAGGAAADQVSGIGAMQVPEGLKPSARVRNCAQGHFASQVVDPASQHKKGGSAALPWSHQRPPAVELIGSRLGSAKQGQQSQAAQAPDAAAEVVEASAASSTDASAGSVLGTPDASCQLDGEADLADQVGGGRRQPLGHTSPSAASRSPSYTPAPPEALIDARNRRSSVQTFVRAALDAAASRAAAVEVALGGVEVHGASVDAHVHGEALPRRFQDVTATMRLGPAYDTLSVDISAAPHERHPSALRCTMPSPHAHRHLRHVTGAAAMRAYDQQQQQPASPSTAEEGADASSSTPPAGPAFSGRPTGGRVRIRVEASGLAEGAVPPAPAGPSLADGQSHEQAAGTASVPVPSLDIRVEGRRLHAPIIERLIELPMDISAGRADGELRICSHDAASWHFPEFHGRVNVRGADFHFWDATDDILGADLDLLFEGDRLYLHNASGSFGSVPLTLTGDLDLNPVSGQYRLSADVPCVEMNQLRATLGVRPTPQPVAGGVAGVLHVTGPLEKPIFSGTAWAVRPNTAQLADCEDTDALEALLAEPTAVGAWDRVPLSSAGAVFSLDMSRETFELHSAHVGLADGGQLRASGSMWVAPRAEMDPSAVSMRADGLDMAAEALLRRYLPEGVALPPGMVMGRANLKATLQGSHLEPTLDLAAQLPEASASCTANLRRTAARVTLASPHADTAATLHLLPPSFEAVKAAVTQAQSTALAVPNVAGVDGEVGLRGLDVVPLLSGDGQAALRQLAVQSGQPLRLKLAGRAKVSGVVQREQAPQALATAAGQPAPTATATADAAASQHAASWEFAGDLGLESVRVNQLKLFQKLAARLSVSSTGVSVHGKGQRASETLDLHLALPPPGPAIVRQQNAAAPAAGTAAAVAPAGRVVSASAPEAPGAGNPGASAPDASATEDTVPAAASVPDMAQQGGMQRGGGGLQMRCGPLHVAADINAAGSQLDFKAAGLKLDELELASLRGDLQEASCSLNFDTHTGRGKVSLANPRYSGLQGDSLSGGFRWEHDVVRLEKLVVQQQRSRYEVQGEYSLPPNTPLPNSAADLALPGDPGNSTAATSGRWRVQVSVPSAELQEIVPAARLLQSATSLTPAEYERAKATFLQAIDQSSIKAAELNTQLRLMAEQLQPAASDGNAGAARQDAGRSSEQLHLPGLQDVRGQWSGSIQAYGGGSSATSCDFDVKGQWWQWGPYGLDALLANGSFHSEEGVALQEFVLKAGDAKLSVRGSLLGEHQDASLLLTDFPMATLHPVFRAVPALQHTAPAVPAERTQPMASPRPLGMLSSVMGRASKGLGLPVAGLADADSPINGLLYISGNIAGSRAQPTGEVAVRLYDAAVGQTRLSQAQASARLSEAQQLSFNVELVPAEGHRQAGYVRVGGVLPVAEAAASSSSKAGEVSSQQHMDVRLSVKDGGMALVTSVTPDLRWQGGLAAIDVRLRGPLEQPVLSGSASISRATLDCPLLRFPLTNASAEVRAGGGMLTVEALEARCGRRGHIRARGRLPVYTTASTHGPVSLQHKLAAEAVALELRVRNMYSGQYDASLAITNSLTSPTVAGGMRFSKGIVFIVPQGAPDVAGAASATSGALFTSTGMGAGSQQQGVGSGGGASVAKVFDILTRGESGVAQQFEAVMKQEVEAVESMVEDAGQHNVALDQLSIALGPDLRAMYPLVMNFGVEGELAVSGPAHPDQVRVQGSLRLPSGDVNLVATQLALDRDHANLITFQQEQSGIDPLVDLVMSGGDLRVAIKGKASEWQEHLTLHYISNKARPDSGEQLDAADAARLFEDKLKAALLAEDGQLALSRLAGTTVSTLMPKIETQGALGGTRWRLVSAPSIPSLLSLDPSLADPGNILSSITMGTEVEIQFGNKLQAAMTRKLQESDVTTQWALNYKLNSKLRMQFNITSAPPFPKTLMFHWSSMGNDS